MRWRYLYASAFEDGDATVGGSKIDTDDGSIIFLRIRAREERRQNAECGEEGTGPQKYFYDVELLHVVCGG